MKNKSAMVVVMIALCNLPCVQAGSWFESLSIPSGIAVGTVGACVVPHVLNLATIQWLNHKVNGLNKTVAGVQKIAKEQGDLTDILRGDIEQAGIIANRNSTRVDNLESALKAINATAMVHESKISDVEKAGLALIAASNEQAKQHAFDIRQMEEKSRALDAKIENNTVLIRHTQDKVKNLQEEFADFKEDIYTSLDAMQNDITGITNTLRSLAQQGAFSATVRANQKTSNNRLLKIRKPVHNNTALSVPEKPVTMIVPFQPGELAKHFGFVKK